MCRIALIALASLALFGCWGITVDRLPEGTRFREITAVSDVTGVFENQGVSPSGEWRPLLTEVLFAQQKFADPPSQVRFESPAPTVLRCEAIHRGEVVAAKEIVAGRDFQLADGSVQLDRRLIEPAISAAGAGFGTESTCLRLNDAGDVVLVFRGGGVGLMLFVVPWGGVRKQEAIFKRVEPVDA
jgi:hypothetical protein